jgi:hypothetical protein
MRWAVILFLFTAILSAQVAKPDADEDFRVYTDSPRLMLTKQRLRLLQRERERQSMRWQQFDALVSGGAPMPEPGVADALYYRVSGNAAAGKKAVEWALSDKLDASKELRQLALVFDWCGPVMTPGQTNQLAARIERAIGPEAQDITRQSARALAAIAIADQLKDHGDSVLHPLIANWWRKEIIPQIAVSSIRSQAFPLLELMHAVRDNLTIDLRDSAPTYFQQFPIDHLAGHYPASYPGKDNDLFIPVYANTGDPDVKQASLSRAAALALVAYDANSQETQYLQGWLMQDRFNMRDSLGAVYEFLWANPYQPGLSYSLLPLVFHNSATGHVFARTSWEEDAAWMGYFEGQLQIFQDGKLQSLRPGTASKPMRIGEAVLVNAPSPASDGLIRFHVDTEAVFLMGLAPHAAYDLEIDDQELSEAETDAGGTLVLELPPHTDAGVRIRKR